MRSWRAIAVLLLCLVLVSSGACSPLGGSSKEETSQQLIKVVRGDLTVSVSGSGNISIFREVRLTFGSSGRIDKIFVNEGDKVTKGEVLAKLEIAPLELALAQAKVGLAQVEASAGQAQAARAQAQAALEQAEYNLEQLEQFLTTPPEKVRIARSQLEAAQTQLEATQIQFKLAEVQFEAAKLSLVEAQKRLDEATITAPFDGVVANVGVKEGNTVSATTSIVHLIDPNSMELKAKIDEIDIPSVKLNQRAVISIDALPSLKLESKVSSISPLATVQAGLVVYDVTISFGVPDGSEVKVGMSATADIIVDERSNVLLLSNRFIKQDSSGKSVVKVMVNGQIAERVVVTGISDGLETEIVSGLDEDETVVIEVQPTTESSSPGGFLFGG